MYLQAMHSLSPLVPKTFKPSYQGNVYSQEPQEESEDWSVMLRLDNHDSDEQIDNVNLENHFNFTAILITVLEVR